MEVIQTGRGCYSVSSLSHPDCPNTVDLEAHGGLGECTCEDWKYKCYPNILKAKALGGPMFVTRGKDRQICKHVRVAMWKNYILFTTERSKQNTTIQI